MELLPRLGVKSARNRMMIVYFREVLRRHLFLLLLLITIAYTSMSSFGIAQEQPAVSGDPAPDQNTPDADDSNPYSAIIRANVFHLTDAPKPVEKPDQILQTLPKVNISGFLRHSDQPVRALFATVPKDPKELPRYFNLAEGEKEDILQVTKIYPNQDAVDVIIAGTPVTLTTKSNSFVQPLPPPPKGGMPGVPAPAAVAYNPPQAAPAQNPYSGGVVVAGGGSAAPVGGSSVVTIGGNNGSPGFGGGSTGVGSSGGFGGQGLASAGGANSALRSIPIRGGPIAPAFPAEYHPQSAQESAAMMAIDAQLHEADIQGGRYPPPPPPAPH
ncbi:MAG: hypothetical protein JWO95_1002 [Verrucomicrobiales bacterium]|nr:hypothetical protein [Verrucomicrobiales bacterium]